MLTGLKRRVLPGRGEATFTRTRTVIGKRVKCNGSASYLTPSSLPTYFLSLTYYLSATPLEFLRGSLTVTRLRSPRNAFSAEKLPKLASKSDFTQDFGFSFSRKNNIVGRICLEQISRRKLEEVLLFIC